MGKKYNKLYRAYYELRETLKDDYTFNYYIDGMDRADNGEDKHSGEIFSRYIDMDWVEAIEYALPYIQNAVDEMRRTIISEEEVVNVAKIKKVGPDTVKHLASHANFISKIDEHGDVIPNNLLNVRKEDTYNIYENRMLFTLLTNISRFISERFRKLRETPEDSLYETHIHRDIDYHGQKIKFNFDFRDENHEVEAVNPSDNVESLSDFDRVVRIRKITQGILNSQLMKELVGCEVVRSPLTMTNLLKKNPNFKEAVQLWTFLEKYKKPGFVVEKNAFNGEMSKDIKRDIYGLMSLNRFVMEIEQSPALKEALHERYLEEKAEEEALADQGTKSRIAFEKKLKEVRQEEMNIRLQEIRERETEIHKLKATIEQLNMTLELREQQIVELTNKLNLAYEQIEDLKKEIMALEEEIEKLKAEIQRLLGIIEEQKKKIAELEDKVEKLTAELEKAKAEITRLLELEKQLRAEIDSLNKEIEKLNGIIAKLKEDIAERDRIIANQKAEISSLNNEVANLNNTIETERKEHSAEISRLNLEHKNEVDTLVANHNNEIASINTKHSEEISTINSNHQNEVAEINRKHSENVNSINAEHKAEVEEINSKNAENINKLNADFDKKMANEKANFQNEMSKQQASFQKEKDSLNQTNEKERKIYEAKLVVLKDEQEKEISKINTNHSKEIEKLHRSAADSLAKERKIHQSEIAKVKKQKDRAYSEEEKKFNQKLKEVEKRLEKEYNKKVKEIREQEAKKVKAIKLKAKKKMFTAEELENIK